VSSSRKILLGLIAGVAVGLFLGERAAFLEWPAKAFVQLLGVTVLPYLVTSLVIGIAGGSVDQARRLAFRGGLAILVLWTVSLALVFLSTVALPPEKGGSFYSNAAVSTERQIDWIDLYIPSNPFYALANNVVPAVVVFSILLGIALLGLADKERVLAGLRPVNDTLARAGTLVVRLTPVGIFAIAGHSAGTLRVEEFARLQAFMVVSIGLSLILTIWILPGLTSAVTGLSFRRILALCWDPLITAFVTANLFIVLPLLQERGKQLLAEARLTSKDASEAVDVLVPTSFTIPHSAKLLSLSFILFAGWFAGAPLAISKFPRLATVGLLSMFGSLNTAVPFMLDLMRLPSDLFQLFVVSSVVNSRFGSAAAAMHTFALALLGAHFMSGRPPIAKRRLLMFGASTVVIVGSFLFGSRRLLSAVLPAPEAAAATFDRLHPSGAWGRLATVETMKDRKEHNAEPESLRGRRLDEILNRGSLRVCVSPDAMPWCYVNSRGEIMGFDLDLAHAMAVQLNTRLVLVPIERAVRGTALVTGRCDVFTGRVVPSESASMAFSRAITDEAWAFLTLDYRRDEFASPDRIRQLASPRIAVFREKEWIDMLKARLPNADVIGVDSIPEFINAPAGRFDAMFTGYDRALAYSMAWPQFAAVLPSPDFGSVPIAIAVPAGEEALVDYANAVVEVGNASGVFKEKLDYWIQGKGSQLEKEPRWSIGRNVLGWWKD
jgi:Na+/H+-dicarboxylate symporter/ABC-type amino acid transport substrate-binding protein